MRPVRLASSLVLVGLAACGTVSLGDEADDGGDGGDGETDAGPATLDATSTDSGYVTPVADGGAMTGRDATADAATAPDASHPGSDASTDAATDANDAGDASDAGDSATSPWVVEDAGTTDTLYAVGGSGPNDVYIGSNKGVYHSKGDGVWTLEPTTFPVESVSAAAPGRIYTDGEFGGVDEGSGDGTWSYLTSCSMPTAHPPPTPPSGGGGVAAFGTTLYYTFNENQGAGVCAWTDDDSDAGADGGTHDVTWYGGPSEIDAVFTSDTGQAYIVGSLADEVLVAARSGTTWTVIPPAVMPAPSGFIGGFALGSYAWFIDHNEIYQSESLGAFTLRRDSFPAGLRLFGIWAVPSPLLAGAFDLWLVASDTSPAVIHARFDGDIVESLPQSPGLLTAIWGSGGTDIYAVGENGAILHRKGP